MKKVLQFPKEKTRRVLALQKADANRFFLAMSLFSLTLVVVFANEQLLHGNRPVYVLSEINESSQGHALKRVVASVQPMHAFRDLDWEHQLAQRLGRPEVENRAPASVAERITLMDDLKYGPLAGKYRLSGDAEHGRLHHIEYVQSDEVTDKPVSLGDTKSFLIKYSQLLNAEYTNTELSYSNDGEELWQLLDQTRNVVGRARVNYDQYGHLLGLHVEKNN